MSDEALLEASTETETDVGTETQAPAAEAPSQAAAPQEQSVWSSFRALPDFKGQDDRQIAGRLYASLEREKAATKALQQYQQLIPYAQEYLTHRDSFEQWRRAQSEPQAPAAQPVQQRQQQAQEEHKWWNPPQVRESSKRYLIRDESGREIIDPNAPITARDELYEYQKYKADFAQRFLADPQSAIGPMVEQVAAERARQIVQDQLREVGEAGYVSTLEKENSDWLYEKDGSTPTREGLMIQHYIGLAAKSGLMSPQERWQYACDMVERDLLREAVEARNAPPPPQFAAPAAPAAPAQDAAMQVATQAAATAPAQNQAEEDMKYLRREASRNPSRSAPATDPRIPKGPMTFEQRLRAQMRRDGID